MPRGGSKKGERRGNAKARTGMETPNEIMHSAVKMARKAKKPGKHGPAGDPPKARIEDDIHLSQLVHGRRSAYDLTPKEVMLENMHFFQNAAYMAKAMAMHISQRPPSEERARSLNLLDLEEERARRIASDEAYKVAPYIHPRLAAIHMSGATDAGEDIVMILLQEIDRKAREQPLVIEHMPQKRTA